MATISEDSLLPVVDRIYESVERPDLWPETIRAIGELVGGRRDFSSLDPVTRDPGVYSLGNACHPAFFLSKIDLKEIDHHALEFGELITRFVKLVFLGTLWPSHGASVLEAAGLGMARRFPQAFEPWEGTSAVSAPRPAWRDLLAALWQDGRVFSRDNLRCMRLLAPHLDRALRLQMRLSAPNLGMTMVSGAFDCLTLGVVFTNIAGRALWLNRRAREITNGSDVLRLAATAELVGRPPSDNRSLQDLITGAMSSGSRSLLTLNRGVDLRPLLLVVVPLKPTGALDPSLEAVAGAVFLVDPDRTDDPTIASLRQAFALTYREAQMTIAVSHGNGLKAAAATMGVAPSTARSQLQQVFAKTGTKQQAELSALVHRTLTHLRLD